jgi:hypothetical protein
LSFTEREKFDTNLLCDDAKKARVSGRRIEKQKVSIQSEAIPERKRMQETLGKDVLMFRKWPETA